MQTQTAEQTTAEQLKDFAKLLQNNGFQVIISRKHPFKWMFFEKDGKLGTVSPGDFFGFNFGTVNKPSHKHGTGYSITRESELSLQSAIDSLALVGWGSGEGVEKYKDAADFIKRNAWAGYYILESEVQSMTTGTSHFVNFTKACDYYKDYEPDATPAELERIVRRKIDEGQIELGQPTIKQGETLSIIDDGCRYAIKSEVEQ